MGLIGVAGVAVEECATVDLATELKGASIASRGSSAAVVIASLGLGGVVTMMAGGDAGGRCGDSARCEASPSTRWLGAWVKSWVRCLARSSWEDV